MDYYYFLVWFEGKTKLGFSVTLEMVEFDDDFYYEGL